MEHRTLVSKIGITSVEKAQSTKVCDILEGGFRRSSGTDQRISLHTLPAPCWPDAGIRRALGPRSSLASGSRGTEAGFRTHRPVVRIARLNENPIRLGGLPVVFHGYPGRDKRDLALPRERREAFGASVVDVARYSAACPRTRPHRSRVQRVQLVQTYCTTTPCGHASQSTPPPTEVFAP